MNLKKSLKTYLPGILLFLVAIVITMLTYQDYGMAWDEADHRLIGNINYDYAVHHKTKEFKEFVLKEYGAGFEMFLIAIERRMHISNIREITLMRHFVTHIFFLIGSLFGYILIYRLFKSQLLACIGFIMLTFEPGIYAHSFFNTKDIPILTMFIISFTFCQAAFEQKKNYLFLLLGIACGFMTGIRVMGILLVLIILFFLITDLITSTVKKEQPRKQALFLLLFVVGFYVTIYASWPFLWGNPYKNFLAAYDRMSHYIWNSALLLNGKVEMGQHLPRSYFPIWFLISNPVLWLITAAAGIIWILVAFCRRPLQFLQNTNDRNFLIYLGCFAIPIFAIIYLRSVIYDGWRHLYFIYPSFVLLALYFVNKIYQTKYRPVIVTACVIQLIDIQYFMIRYHPLQQVYFNQLVSHDREYLRRHYDFEYWGASYMQALEYLVKKHPYGKITLCYGAGGQPTLNNINMLQERDRQRVEVIDDCSKADYFITNFRWHPEDYPNPVEWTMEVQNSTAVCIYRTIH